MKPTPEKWLENLVDSAPYGTKGRLALYMGIDGTKLSRIIAGKRKLSIDELQRAAEFFGEPLPLENVPNAKIRGEL